MRMHKQTLAVAATVFSLAGGGGVAWACSDGGNGYPGATTGTGTTTTTTTTGTTTSATTSSTRKSHRKKHSKRHAQRA